MPHAKRAENEMIEKTDMNTLHQKEPTKKAKRTTPRETGGGKFRPSLKEAAKIMEIVCDRLRAWRADTSSSPANTREGTRIETLRNVTFSFFCFITTERLSKTRPPKNTRMPPAAKPQAETRNSG